MSVAKVTEITSSSSKSIEDAIETGIDRASKTLKQVKGAWVQQITVECEDGKVTDWRVNMKVSFILKD